MRERNEISLLSLFQSMHAVLLIPWPPLAGAVVSAMDHMIVIEPNGGGISAPFWCGSTPPVMPRNQLLSSSIFLPLCKEVFGLILQSIDPALLVSFFEHSRMFLSYPGNRRLELTDPPLLDMTRKPPTSYGNIRSTPTLSIDKRECMYRTNWNRKTPLGASNVMHSGNFSSPQQFSAAIFTPTTGPLPDHLMDALWTLRVNCNLFRCDVVIGSYCPLPEEYEKLRCCDSSEIFKKAQSVPYLTTPHGRVAYTVCKLLETKLFPPELWHPQWRELVHAYVLLERFEVLKLHVKKFPKNFNFPLHVVHFLFKRVVVPLISFLFYCTETDSASNRVVYFRRPVWNTIVSSSSSAMVEMLQLDPTNELGSASSAASVRWLPKLSGGFRPVVRQAKHVKERTKRLLRYLTAVKAQNADKLGNSVFSRDVCYSKFLEFAETLRSHNPADLQYLSVDIQNCFESIPFGPLAAALTSFCPNPNARFSSVLISSWSGSDSTVRRKPITFFHGNLANLIDLSPNSKDTENPVYISASLSSLSDERLTYTQVKGEIMKIVTSACYALNTKGTTTASVPYRVSSHGLPQGSSFSTILVGIYFGYLDSVHNLSTLHLPRTMIVRLVDDILCVTVDREELEKVKDVLVERSVFGPVNLRKMKAGYFLNPPTSLDWAGFRLSPDRLRMLNLSVSPVVVAEVVGGLPKNTRRSECDEKVSILRYLSNSLSRSIAQHTLPLLMDDRISGKRCVNENARKAGATAGSKLMEIIRSGGVDAEEVEVFVRKLRRIAQKRLKRGILVSRFCHGFEEAMQKR